MRIVAALLALVLIAAAPSVSPQNDPAAQITGTQVQLQAGLDRESPQQNGLAALVAECIMHTPVNGVALSDAATAAGGSIGYSIGPRSVRFYIEASAQQFPQVAGLFRSALAHPDFGAATLAAARTELDKKIAAQQRVAVQVGIEMLQQSFYSGGSAGSPPFGLPETLVQFSSSDAAAFFREHYRQGDAIITSDGSAPGTALPALVDSLPAGSSPVTTVKAAPAPETAHQIVARRDVPVAWLVAQYHAPDVGSRDFGAMLILTELMQRTLSEVSEAPGIATRSSSESGVGAYYDFSSSPSSVVVYVDGGLGDPVRTFTLALGVVSLLGHAKLGGDLSQMKTFTDGRVLQELQTVEERVQLESIFAQDRVVGDPKTLLVQAVNSATAADIQRVARQFLAAPTIALVLPRSK